MDLLFILIGAGLAIFVIFVSFKKEEEIEKEEEVLDKLKNENLTQEELTKIYEDLKKKK